MSEQSRGLEVCVVGSAGYVGGELLRLLTQHPEVSRVRAFSESQAGKPVSAVHGFMAHLPEQTFEAPAPDTLKDQIVFLALPHGRTQNEIGAVLEAQPSHVIDLSADFRIPEQDLYTQFYGPHTRWDLVPSFRYAATDIVGTDLEGARYISVPGCFATATYLGVYPFVKEGWIDGPPVSFAVTGSSGSGALAKQNTHHPARANNLYAYAPTGHRHQAEVVAFITGGAPGPARDLQILTHSGPFVRGIHATVHVPIREGGGDVSELLNRQYGSSAFVQVGASPPQIADVVGSNFAHIYGVLRTPTSAVVYIALDNLVKGAAGQAVQAMNLSLGLDETSGLTFPGMIPW